MIFKWLLEDALENTAKGIRNVKKGTINFIVFIIQATLTIIWWAFLIAVALWALKHFLL